MPFEHGGSRLRANLPVFEMKSADPLYDAGKKAPLVSIPGERIELGMDGCLTPDQVSNLIRLRDPL